MPLTLEQYASYLDTRDLSWPAPPAVERPSARPHLVRLPLVRAVVWNIYGTLLAVPGGELVFEHPNKFVMDLALEKTLQEFKMWGAMTRKPGQPEDYLRKLYDRVLADLRLAPSRHEKYPEIGADRIWEGILKKLFQKDYQFDAGYFGSLNEFSKKVAYFFHASLQGSACYAGADTALAHVRCKGLHQGLLADAQCFTLVQLQRGLARLDDKLAIDDLFDLGLRSLSFEHGSRKPSERLFKKLLLEAWERGISPPEILHIGSRAAEDILPARRLGMRTGLFAGDKASLQATTGQLKDPASRPDVLLTRLDQISKIL